MAVIQKTEFEVRCSTCHNQKIVGGLTSHDEAQAVDRRHKSFHKRFKIGTAVVAPAGVGRFRERGRITSIWYDMEKAVVTFDRLVACTECEHPHMKARSARVRLAELTVPR